MNDDFEEIFNFTRLPPPSHNWLKVLVGVATLLIAALTVASIVGVLPDYSHGERVGVVTKLSYKGIRWKSWEGSLNEGGTRLQRYEDGKPVITPNVMEFNVQDPAVIKTLQEAMETGRRVKITYRQWFIAPVEIDNSSVVGAAVVVD